MRLRVRYSVSPFVHWGLGIGRSHWALPKPKGMNLYVIHLLWLNLVLEVYP